MSLFDWLSPALTATTNTVGAYQGAQADATKEQVAAQVQALKQQHDAERQALQDQVSRATARHLDAESEKLNRPVPKKVYDAARGVMVNEDEGSFAAIPGLPDKPIAPKFAPKSFVENGTPVEGLVDEEGKFWHADHTPATGKITPWSPPQHDPPPQIISAVDPQTNAPKFFRVPKEGGDATEIGGIAPKPTAAGGTGAMGQAVQARLLGAVAEARAASKRMDAYEEKMLADPAHATPGLLTQLGGKLATRMAGQHSLSGIAGETLGEATTSPDYLQYVRDAGLMARATQLMSSRGGSESMVSAEQLLNRAVPNANGLAGSVAAARKSRNAIFGPVGGLMQALTPDQIAKVEAGLAALEKGDSESPALRAAAQIIEGVQRGSHPGSPGAKGGATPAQALWDAAVAKHGQQKVLDDYGPRPDE